MAILLEKVAWKRLLHLWKSATHINTRNASTISVLQRLARNDRNIEVDCVNTELAFSTYENVTEAADTETKSCIGTDIGMTVNGSMFDDFPFSLSARNAVNESKQVKILRVPDGSTSLSSRQQDVLCESESVKFANTDGPVGMFRFKRPHFHASHFIQGIHATTLRLLL